MIFVMTDHLANHALGVFEEHRMRDVHVLPDAVRGFLSSKPGYQDLGMLMVEPRWDRIGRCAENHADARLVQAIDNPIHPCEFKLAIARFPTRPGGLAEADYGHPGLLHQLDV